MSSKRGWRTRVGRELKRNRISRAAVAKAVGKNASTVSRWLLGTGEPTVSDAYLIAELVGKHIDDLFLPDRIRRARNCSIADTSAVA